MIENKHTIYGSDASIIMSTLLNSFIKENYWNKFQIESYNDFVKRRLPKIIKSIGTIKPDIPELGDLKIVLGDIKIGEPSLRESDGSVRRILPFEARLRNLTYSAPLFVEMTTVLSGIESEPVYVYFGELPVMVKSDICPLSKMSREELRKVHEDPDDPGGYFIINGAERILVLVEEIASNKPVITKTNTPDAIVSARINSEREGYITKHLIELKKNGIVTITFSALHKFPVVILLKALGLEKDVDILNAISDDPEVQEEFLINLYEYEVLTKEDAIDEIGKYLRIPQKRLRKERAQNLIDKYLLLHLGQTKKDRIKKAIFLAKIVERMIKVALGKQEEDDIDHYSNKRLRLAGDLLEILFRSVLLGRQGLINRISYNYQKLSRRGRLPPLQAVVESNILTNQIVSAMAVGTWVGGRTGTCQILRKENLNKSVSHMRYVHSPLKTTQEHFEARELHPTHFGKLCVAETPEGATIGLRKHLALFASVTHGIDEKTRNKAVKTILEVAGIKGE